MNNEKQDCIIIADPGSVDPDDIFSLMILPIFNNVNIKGVIATHFYAAKRALLAKLVLTEVGRSDIDVYAGKGIPYTRSFNAEYRKDFLKRNSLFPALFGYPKNVSLDTEKEWFPNFMKAFEHLFDEDDNDFIIYLDVKSFLECELKAHSTENKLLVICIGPLHDLADINFILYPNMDLWCMGGGFELFLDDNEKSNNHLAVPKVGYNWGISPEATQKVLHNLIESGQQMKLISSGLVRRKNVSISLEKYNEWMDLFESGDSLSRLSMAVMQDWLYCNRENKLSEHKNLCDPLTLFLALGNYDPEFLDVHCELDLENNQDCTSYLETQNLIIMDKVSDNNHISNVKLVVDFDDTVIDDILSILDDQIKISN